MTSEAEIFQSTMRLRRLWAVFGCALVLLVLVLFRVQIVKGAFYNERLRQQSLRSVKLAAPRGRIFDRNGVCLADNRPSYGVAIYFQELRRETSRRRSQLQAANEVIASLSAVLGPPGVTTADIQRHLSQKPSVPMVIWRDLDAEKVAAFAEQVTARAGVELDVSAVREYPLGRDAAHVLGYLGQKEDSEEDEREGYYLQPEMVGKAGLEWVLDRSLRGTPGGRIVQIDAMGFTESVVNEILPEPGADAFLTIDARLQKVVESALASAPMPGGRPVRGAAVLVDATNGDILAMASLPTFDPNMFARGISLRDFSELLNDPGKPFLHRAIRNEYPPGSVFKPFVMLAGLESGAVNASSTADCSGAMQIGKQKMRCWAQNGHGHVGYVAAMRSSCDVFFYQHGLKMGIRPIKQMADAFGFGQTASLPLTEGKGLSPDDLWLWEKYRERWTDGRTANVAIGQGEVLVTPLQMALATAALANGGTLWSPRLMLRLEANGTPLERFDSRMHRRITAGAANMETVRKMMLEVVEGQGGTGGRSRVAGVRIAGKTGTAEVGPPTRRRHMVWFTAFAPYDQPRFALAVVIEDGDHGGTTAAPVAAKIFATIYERHYQMPTETESNSVD